MNILLLKDWLREQGPALIGAKLLQVRQLDPRSMALEFSAEGTRLNLLLSVLEEFPALAVLEDDSPELALLEPECNFAKAAAFHLSGYRLVSIEQQGFDRSVVLGFRIRDMYGQEKLKYLRHELASRASNAYLLSDRGMVVSIFKRVRQEQNRVRRILTGKLLPDPPPLGKYVAGETGLAGLEEELAQWAASGGVDEDGGWDGFFSRRVAGVDQKLWPAVEQLMPVEYDTQALYDFIVRLQSGALTPQLFAGPEGFPGANATTLLSWRQARLKRGFHQPAPSLQRERIAARLDQLMEQHQLAQRADDLEHAGVELLSHAEESAPAEAQRARLAQWQAAYPAWADQISLELSVSENAQGLIHYAQRLRRGATKLEEMIAQTQDELTRMEQAPTRTRRKAQVNPLTSAAAKLEKQGVKYVRFQSTDGFPILCGLNDQSNDGLLRLFGGGHNLWLHARDFPGSHVFILASTDAVPQTTVEQAAVIAAYHSQGRDEPDLDVSLVPAKQLRRPRQGKPGQVLKMQETVLTVRPAHFQTIREQLRFRGKPGS